MEENRFDLELVAETVTHLRVTVKKGDEYARGVIYGGVREVGSMAMGSMEAVELDENGSGRLVMPEVSCRGGYYDVYYYDAERGYECKLVWGKIVATPRLAPAMSEQLVEFEAGVPVQDGGEVVVQMAVGERGEKGEKGDKGDKGEPGVQGEPGVPGDVWGEIRLKDADIVPMYELGVNSYGIDFYYTSGSGMRYAGRLGLEESEYNGKKGLKLHDDMPLVIGGTRFSPELMGGAVIKSDGTLIFDSPSSGGNTLSIYGTTTLETVTAKSATFSGDVTTGAGIHVLPLGKKTALGADAYGLSVSADGGLQLWGTHFMQGSIWGENGLKMVQNEVSLTSTDSAAIGFDFANTVDFRTMPNDGDGHGVYRFQCWHWTDDSHTAIEEGTVDVRKKAAMSPTDESLLNRAENDRRYGKLAEANEWSGVQTIYAPDGKYGANKIIQIRDASGEYPGYNICFRNGGSLEIFDESQDPTRHEPYFQIWRPGGNRTYACRNFCVKGTTEMRKAVTLTSSSSLTANCPATFKGAVTFTQAPVVPVASGPSEALNFAGWAYQKARADFRMLVLYGMRFAYKSIEAIYNLNELTTLRNATIDKFITWSNNIKTDFLFAFKATTTDTMSIGVTKSCPHTASHIFGFDSRLKFITPVHRWVMQEGCNGISVQFGGVNYETNPLTHESHNHPIHWTHQAGVTNYRFPRFHTSNTTTGHSNPCAYELTFYGNEYLGATSTMLLRAFTYDKKLGESGGWNEYVKYKWALVPKNLVNFAVVPLENLNTSTRAYCIVKNVLMTCANNKIYRVMDMIGTYMPGNSIYAYNIVAKKTKDLNKLTHFGADFAKFDILGDNTSGNEASRVAEKVVEEFCEDYLPIPEVTADITEIPAEGGTVILTVAPTSHNENIYCLNDTMDGSGQFEFWCTQDVEELPATGGQITLSIAPNTTGEDRELWVFVGHHYAEARKVELVQKGE